MMIFSVLFADIAPGGLPDGLPDSLVYSRNGWTLVVAGVLITAAVVGGAMIYFRKPS